MRTTITIHDSLLRQAKEASLQRGCTLGEVIEDALRATLSAQKKSVKKSARPWRTFRGSGVRPGVALDAAADLLEIMEGR